jgi:hypothetical protein
MSCPALLSCLGVSGWGPLHWWLWRGGEPEAVMARLRQAWWQAAAAGAAAPRAALLLASLLRSGTDLLPLAGVPTPPPGCWPAFRHRLVCRRGGMLLHLRSWEYCVLAGSWRPCRLERRLDVAWLSQGLRPVASAIHGEGDGVPSAPSPAPMAARIRSILAESDIAASLRSRPGARLRLLRAGSETLFEGDPLRI